MSEPVRIQIKMSVLTKQGHNTLQDRGRMAILKDWSATGAVPDGLAISAVKWENYARNKPERTAETEEDIERARETLHLAELFQTQEPKSRKVRRSKGIRKRKPAANRRRQKKHIGRKKAKQAKRSIKARAKKRAKSRSHATVSRRMDKSRAKQRKKGMARNRKNKRRV